tara:strand:- start:61207 stop:63588 length:2382 start_codon:yes stop_codon:yes gene_type:complete
LRTLITLLCLVCSCYFVTGQKITDSQKLVLSGKVVTLESDEPLEYATISLKKEGQDLVIGTTTNNQGMFNITLVAGVYDIKIDFLSFETYELKSKALSSDLDLGIIKLKTDNDLEEVEVVANQKLLEFKVNKKIYNASADIANKGGNAIDVLINAPSVRVDFDGNVKIRGSAATILIDGKPQFNIDNNIDFLKAMPANNIDKVEIITRSAKYSAEGGGAILNIVTKKRKGAGLSGSFEVHTGIPDNHGFSSFINENTDKMNLFSTISFNHENKFKSVEIKQPLQNLFENINEDGPRNSFLFNLGSDFYINSKNTLTTSFLINAITKNTIFQIDENDFNRRTNDADDLSKLEAQLGYTSKFDENGHKLNVGFKYESTISDTKDDITEIPTGVNPIIYQQSFKDQQLDNFLAQIDYTLPFNETSNLELGYKGTFRTYSNIFNVLEFNNTTNNYATLNNLDGIFDYKENVHGFYGLYNASHQSFSYSLGLRTELSNITIDLQDNTSASVKNYTDLFPSVTLGYELGEASYASLNYSRSIDRPSVPQISPFLSFADQRFQSVGNQDLNPFYTDYFELLFDKSFDKLTLTSSLFLNYQKNHFLSVIQNTGQSTSNGDEIFRRLNINSGDKNIIGLDLDIIYMPFKGLRLNGYVSPYRQEITNAINPAYNNKSTVWYAEASALVTINNGLKVMLSNTYQSQMKFNLTKLGAINFSNVIISKNLFKNNASLTFKVVDLFNSRKFVYESTEANTETYRTAFYENQYSLSFTYRFKQTRRSNKDRSNDINKNELEDKQDKKL